MKANRHKKSAMRITLYLLAIAVLAGCQSKAPTIHTGREGGAVTVAGRWPEIKSTITVERLGGGPAITQFTLDETGRFKRTFNWGQAGLAVLRSGNNRCPLLLEPGQAVRLQVDAEGSLIADDPGNEVYQYVVRGFDRDLAERAGRFLRWPPQESFDLVMTLADGYRQYVADRSEMLSAAARRLILFEIDRRQHLFLFNYATFVRPLPPEHSFYDFTAHIDPGQPYYADNHLGLTVLKKYDIQFRREGQSVKRTRQFFDYLGREIKDASQRAFYRSYYLLQLLEDNKLLRNHLDVFDVSDAASMDFHLGEGNPYRYLYADALQRYYEIRQGKRAKDFTVLNADGTEAQLSDFDGKVIYMDAWASWCGPCMAELPYLYELADHYKGNPDFLILTLSFDYSYQKWQQALDRQEKHPNIVPLFVADGVNSTFAEAYLVSSIPDYKLINRERGVVTLEAPHPSDGEAVRRLIDETLAQKSN